MFLSVSLLVVTLRVLDLLDLLDSRSLLGARSTARARLVVGQSSQATTGRLFSGARVLNREIPQNIVRRFSGDLLKKSNNDLKWVTPSVRCEKWSVVTTVFEPSAAVRIQAKHGKGWCLVIVGDSAGPFNYEIDSSGKHMVFLDTKTQQEMFAGLRLSELVPWNHFGRKNFGYLYAIAHGGRLVWDFDDDNQLLASTFNPKQPRIREPSDKNSTIVYTLPANRNDHNHSCLSFNPYPAMGAEHLPVWPRGLPLEDIRRHSCQFSAQDLRKLQVSTESIAVYQSLANHDPDVDAIYRLTHPLPMNFNDPNSRTLIVPLFALSSFNAQATLFTYDALFLLLLPVSVHGRVSDIWRSYLAGRLLRDADRHVAFTPPQVIQNRNPHSYLADFDSEQDLYAKSGKLVKFLLEWKPESESDSISSRLEQLVMELYLRDYVGVQDIHLFQEWIQLLVDVDYIFPKVSSVPGFMSIISSEEKTDPSTSDQEVSLLSVVSTAKLTEQTSLQFGQSSSAEAMQQKYLRSVPSSSAAAIHEKFLRFVPSSSAAAVHPKSLQLVPSTSAPKMQQTSLWSVPTASAPVMKQISLQSLPSTTFSLQNAPYTSQFTPSSIRSQQVTPLKILPSAIPSVRQKAFSFSIPSSVPSLLGTPKISMLSSRIHPTVPFIPSTQHQCEATWPQLELFLPIFPGEMSEFTNILWPTMKFFYPRHRLDLLLLVDADTKDLARFKRELWDLVSPHANSVRIVENDPPKIYRTGHDRQQLLMLWADNFTTAEFVGFLDADTFFKTNVIKHDMFDDANRPRVWLKYGPPESPKWRIIADNQQQFLPGRPFVSNCFVQQRSLTTC